MTDLPIGGGIRSHSAWTEVTNEQVGEMIKKIAVFAAAVSCLVLADASLAAASSSGYDSEGSQANHGWDDHHGWDNHHGRFDDHGRFDHGGRFHDHGWDDHHGPFDDHGGRLNDYR
jgi:hypothetical protein